MTIADVAIADVAIAIGQLPDGKKPTVSPSRIRRAFFRKTEWMMKHRWRHLILDEAQAIKKLTRRGRV